MFFIESGVGLPAPFFLCALTRNSFLVRAKPWEGEAPAEPAERSVRKLSRNFALPGNYVSDAAFGQNISTDVGPVSNGLCLARFGE